ncbi:uncharacterized protein LOC122058828 [Macadamia integrifolia]|uniref:uncharacterized protein LOC122058828 n=1 Tax=Macadamia integrifolia TaxID=60698 RepID=UPI001C52855D|nr:uncharacterized protein LOC122058828 [Macadamia integrifolia]
MLGLLQLKIQCGNLLFKETKNGQNIDWPWWLELLEIFSDSSARGDRGLSQATIVTPRSTNLEIDDDDFQVTDNDDSDACTGTPKESAPSKRQLDRTSTDRRRKS